MNLIKLKIKQIYQNKRIRSYIIYTILFCITALIVFAIFIKDNRGFIWNADGFQQHYSIFYDFNQIMRNGFHTFSWDMGLGLDVIRTIFILCVRRSICIYKFTISNGLFRNNI